MAALEDRKIPERYVTRQLQRDRLRPEAVHFLHIRCFAQWCDGILITAAHAGRCFACRARPVADRDFGATGLFRRSFLARLSPHSRHRCPRSGCFANANGRSPDTYRIRSAPALVVIALVYRRIGREYRRAVIEIKRDVAFQPDRKPRYVPAGKYNRPASRCAQPRRSPCLSPSYQAVFPSPAAPASLTL